MAPGLTQRRQAFEVTAFGTAQRGRNGMETGSRTSLADAGLPSLGAADGIEPWEYLERIRALGDVVWDDGMKAELVTSHDLLKEMARADQSVWGSARADHVEGLPVCLDDWLGFVGYHSPHNLQVLQGEAHDAQ